MGDSEFQMVVLASMPKEWMIFISTLGTYTTSVEVIAQIMAHDLMLACDRLSQSTPAVVKALVTAQNQKPQLICTNPVCGRIGHTVDKCFKPGGGMEGQYPNWWKKKGTATKPNSSNSSQPAVTANIATTDSSIGSSTRDGEFYALVTDTNPSQMDTPQRQVVTFADSACSDHCLLINLTLSPISLSMIKMAILQYGEGSLGSTGLDRLRSGLFLMVVSYRWSSRM